MKIQMRNNYIRIILFLLATLTYTGVASTPLKTELNTGWRFKQWRLNNWYPATVPGVIHTDLIANKIIEDPFFRLNERSVQWVDKEDWMYETSFDLNDEMFNKKNIRLHFMGLDTYASVYLNGDNILEGDNMFREWIVPVKDNIKLKGNKLEVLFRSPIKEDIPKWDALPYHYPTGPDQSQQGGIFNKTVSPFARKAGYHYGWDWGPRLVTSGIWRPVYVEAWDEVKLEDVYIRPKDVNKQKASVAVNVEIVSDEDVPNAQIVVKDKNSDISYASFSTDLKKGTNMATVDFVINNPKLWWSNGLGDPYLYEFQTDIIIGSEVVDSNISKTGIRSVKVINKPDQYGTTFYLELNGVPVFMKGANYIPNDNFLPRVTKEIYEKTVLDAVNANMNMLRVWGGGTYENDIFYDLCDQYGILVWQDFMFACSMYPSEGKYLESVRHEAIDNIKRLRNHPSIALWCGNNEAYDGWFGWGRKEDYTKQNPEYARVMWKQYTDLFHKLLPDMVEQYAPGAFYWPSSPYGLPGQGCDDKNGDRHYWEVWHGRKPIAQYNIERSRFFSEYGFQSFPEFESVNIYAPESKDWEITSEVMMEHQRAGSYANNLIEEYLLKEYRKPKDFEAFLYMNQVLQGDAVKIAMEAHRRDMPYCMGTLFWQHNDCWPVASWSSRDYYGRWKAQHYFAREAYKDVLISPIEKENRLSVYVVSDRLTSTKGDLTLSVLSLDGKVVNKIQKKVTIAANTSKDVLSMNVDQLINNHPKSEVVIHARLKDDKGKVYTNNYFLLQQKEIQYPRATISKQINAVDGGYEVHLTSDKFARAVFMSLNGIDNFFENNYFDILPEETVNIKVNSTLPAADFEKQLKVVSLSEAYVD